MRQTFVLALLLAAAPALAQTPLTGNSGLPTSNTPPLSGTEVAPGPAAGPPSGPSAPAEGRRTHGHHARRSLAERFAEANTTHDGRLTLAQAQEARMNAVVRDFGQIDRQNRGYVTLDEIKAFRHERRLARAKAATH
jgi:hypothetical protein